MKITRVEPLTWWVGMKTPLQLMIHGKDLAGCKVKTVDNGIRIKKVRPAENPNYLFLDVEIDKDLEPGLYRFELTDGDRQVEFDYELQKRRRGSMNRESFSSADLVYLLFPDRFANGDPSNDSTPDTREKADREDPFGRHGGDLQGIINHLDYFQKLGVTTLWLTPPQKTDESKQSYHGYGCSDYYHIDPRLGDNALFKKLVKAAHDAGLKVIMDAIPNHCGKSHWWMNDLPFENWVHQKDAFVRSNYRLATITDPNKAAEDLQDTVEGWFDRTMPDIAMENRFALQYFLQLYVWWIEWANLDGLRVDTFPYNDKYFIAEWTRLILEEYPKLNIVAECWHSSASVVSYWLGNNKNKDGYNSYLPSVMDFPLQEAIVNGLAAPRAEWNTGMNGIYEALALDFLYLNPLNLMIFLDNHDTERVADKLHGSVKRMKRALTLLATMRGIPQLYYGTEYGFHSLDPDKGDAYARIDFPGGWEGDRANLFSGRNATKKQKEIFNYAVKLFNWRKDCKAVHKGKTVQFLPKGNTYSFIRYTSEEAVFVFINASPAESTLTWDKYASYLKKYRKGINVISGENISLDTPYAVLAGESLIMELSR